MTQLFIAFDRLRCELDKTLSDIENLSESGKPFGIKFNLDAMLNPDISLSKLLWLLKRFNRQLFPDLKMWNGSRTMESVVKTFVDLGVDFMNVWAMADKEMVKAVKATEGSNTKVLGLTVLSHYGDDHCQKWYRRSLIGAVADFSRYAIEAGCHGIIVPGNTLSIVRHLPVMKMATGVRPEWYKDDRHQQEATPAEVAGGGANFVVCGSPILEQRTKEDRILALHKVLHEMENAKTK